MTLREFAEWLSNLQGYERQTVTLTRIMQEARDALATSEPQGDDSLDTILARMGEPIYDRAFRDRLLRHALYDDEVRQLADAIDALQSQARRLLDIRQRTRQDGTYRATLAEAREGLIHLRASTALEEWWPTADKALAALNAAEPQGRVIELATDPRLPLWVLKADRHIGDIEWWAAIPVELREQVRIEAALDYAVIPEELDR